MLDNAEGKILFKDIVRACTFGNVKKSILVLCPDQKRNIRGYKNVFETLQERQKKRQATFP